VPLGIRRLTNDWLDKPGRKASNINMSKSPPGGPAKNRASSAFGLRTTMRRITQNPYLAFPLGAVIAMTLLLGLSFTQSDPLLFNDAYPVFFLLLPAVAAWYCFLSRSRTSGETKFWDRWAVKWFGTTALALAASSAVWLASSLLIRYGPGPEYNYPRFSFAAAYEDGSEQRVDAGGVALDKTVYTLEGNAMRLSDLWSERPIVIEFGSIT